MEIKGKVALIAGGARMGRAIAEALAERGCSVAVTYRTSKVAAEEMVRSIQDRGVKGLAISVDLRQSSEVDHAVDSLEKIFGRLDILVNMASLYQKMPLETLTEDQLWRDNLETDLGSAYRLALRVAPLMNKRGSGRIINFTDWVAASGRPRYKGYAPYYVAKIGVKGLTEALALELAPTILVNAVAPGPILPPKAATPEEIENVRGATPLARWGGVAEIVKAVLFFIETDFVTGECLRVDGGRHLL
jgi:NAD(P)-dependent dehydrogenase (short-subunit alcohol dehydrogenase family)